MPLYTIVECAIASGEPLGTELAVQKRKSEDRFHLGDQIVINSKPNQILKIVSSIPRDNPPGVNVTYVIEYMSDLNKIAGGSIVDFPQHYLHTKRLRTWPS